MTDEKKVQRDREFHLEILQKRAAIGGEKEKRELEEFQEQMKVAEEEDFFGKTALAPQKHIFSCLCTRTSPSHLVTNQLM